MFNIQGSAEYLSNATCESMLALKKKMMRQIRLLYKLLMLTLLVSTVCISHGFTSLQHHNQRRKGVESEMGLLSLSSGF